jgi:hypothetical protein
MRQSAAFLAVGLGLLLPCLALQFGNASGWEAVKVWAGIGFGLGFVVPAALDGLLAVGERLADLRKSNALTKEIELKNAGRVAPVVIPPAATPVVLRRIRINDRTGTREIDFPDSRTPRWIAWQQCIEAALLWSQARGGITSGVMVGRAGMLRDRGDWVILTDVMAGQQLCGKANGRVTQLAGPSEELLARVREGRCDWPTDRDPPTYSPAPVSVPAELAEAR